jgi:hypothetical protein
MNRETRPTSNPSAAVPSTEDELEPRATAQNIDRVDSAEGPTDGDWPQREAAAKGHPPPDEGDNDASPYGYGDPDEVRDEGVLESLGKAVTSPVREKPDNGVPGRPR